MARFNTATARAMAARSVDARKAAAERAEQERNAIPLDTTVQADKFKEESLARVMVQMAFIDKALEKPSDAKEWDALTRAKERLFKIWAHLAGIAGPGNLRPSKRPYRETRPPAEPI